MIDKPLEKIEAADIESLCFRRAPESRSLEFKRELPGKTDREVKEFLDDVTSLANAQGGDIIYGIAAVAGMADQAVLIDLEERDAEFLRLESILRDSVEPRLTVHLHWIPYPSGAGVLLIRVPASLAFPHRRFYRGSSRFCSRNSAGKYEMDVHELRQAFTQSENLPSRFKALHEEALRSARGERAMPFSLNHDPTVVVTVAPLGLFRDQRDLPITPENAVLPPKASGAINSLRTLEGVLIGTTVNNGGLRAYALTHRDGHVDGAWTIGGKRESDQQLVKKIVWPASFEEGLADLAGATSARLLQFGIVGPWVVLVTVFGIFHFELMVDPYFPSKPAWRDDASFPPLVTEDLKPESLEPIFKSFWRLFGEERSAQL